MQRIGVRVPNWEKYNPRGDVKKPTWFRLEYTVATSEALFDLTFEEKWVFVSLFSYTVEKVTHGEISCRTDWFCRHYGLSAEAVTKAIAKLIANGTLEAINTAPNAPEPTRNADVTPANVDDQSQNADVSLRDGTGRYGTVRDVEERDGSNDTEPIGPIAELREVTGSEILAEVKHKAQRIWIGIYGLEFVKEHLGPAYSKWLGHESRSSQGHVALWLHSWFEKEKKNHVPSPPQGARASPTLRDTGKPCKQAKLTDGTVITGKCSVHMTGDVCQIEGRMK